MYSAETTIVDVKQTGESEYTLSMTAKELYVAAQSGDVIRRHDVSASDKAPEKKYVALSGVKFAEATGKYTFTFASGDVMETTSADAYPTASSISDSTDELPAVAAADKGKFLHTNESTGALEWAEGGSGGGVLVVVENKDTFTLDKTYAEISTAISQGIVYVAKRYNSGTVANIGIIIGAEPLVDGKTGVVTGYEVWGLYRASADPSFAAWVATTENGYPVSE